jgi:hypothetical protein
MRNNKKNNLVYVALAADMLKRQLQCRVAKYGRDNR